MAPHSKKAPLLSDYSFHFDPLPDANRFLEKTKQKEFTSKKPSERSREISAFLFQSLKKAKHPCFLLPAFVDFLKAINAQKILKGYTFETFEIWLNQSDCSYQDQLDLRAKISGRKIPRSAYQLFFPIGNGKAFMGSHTVTGHGAPDLDTTVASFWGWLDAFSAKVAQGQHYWNLPPGGIFETLDAAPLSTVFGKELFTLVAQNRGSLALNASDLLTQKNLLKKQLEDSSLDSEHVRNDKACMIVDQEGYFLGDLRTADYEGIRQIQALMTHTLIWFENIFHSKFIHLFTQKSVQGSEIAACLKELFSKPIRQCLDTQNLSKEYLAHFDRYLKQLLGLQLGLDSSFSEFAEGLKSLSFDGFYHFKQLLKNEFSKTKLYDAKGILHIPREEIFSIFQKVIQELDQVTTHLQTFTQRVDLALKVKRDVFGFKPRYVQTHTSLDELKDKMSRFHHLTVVEVNPDGSLWPLGIIRSEDLSQSILGTVSLRDFCNREEVKVASYLEIISIADHHKAEIKTQQVPVVITGDAQSANVLLAEKNFELNDQFPLGQIKSTSLDTQLSKVTDQAQAPAIRLQQKLLSEKLAQLQHKNSYVHPDRAYLEYLSYLYAIIDDTDLLSKVTTRDLFCVAELLNRMKSIQLGHPVEIIDLHKIANEPDFIERATRLLVQHEDLYSLYRVSFEEKEAQLDSSIVAAADKGALELFADVKIQNGCCRVSQTKVFSTNASTLEKYSVPLMTTWSEKAKEVYENNSTLDLHVHMMSTIPNAQEVYKGEKTSYTHTDALWIWIPGTKQSQEHLASFIHSFRNCAFTQNNHMNYQVLGSEGDLDVETLMKASFPEAPKDQKIKTKKKVPVIVLNFDPSTLNSRKAHITPFLPLLVK